MTAVVGRDCHGSDFSVVALGFETRCTADVDTVRSAMRVISWNVQGRLRDLPVQLQALMKRQPDLVALQEVQGRTVTQWRMGLQQHGLLIASRWPITQLPWMDVPYQERVLSVQVATPWASIELHNAHVPNSDKYGWIQVETFEG